MKYTILYSLRYISRYFIIEYKIINTCQNISPPRDNVAAKSEETRKRSKFQNSSIVPEHLLMDFDSRS